MNDFMLKYTEFLQCLVTHKKDIWSQILNMQKSNPSEAKVYLKGFNKLERQVTDEIEELYDTLLQISNIEKELEK